jgi:D-serine deaminase-like pyridoxal phosphate-dependent protein
MIITPTLLVDEQKCRANIRRMAEKARANNLIFRPHFKTHQSHLIGQWFRDEGVTKITTSSLGMAAYFAEVGWEDITVAFPANVREIDTINELAERITLNLLVESVEAVAALVSGVRSEVNLFIKIDVGTHRTGMNPIKTDEIRAVISVIEKVEFLHFAGFLCHAGHSYGCRGKADILRVHGESMTLLSALRTSFSDIPDLFISYGDTPTCSIADSFAPVNELRPGNFVFYDIMQQQIGSCMADQIAVAVACPVVAKHPERGELVIYGGGVHFSKDVMEEHGQKVFGHVVAAANKKWGARVPDVYISKLSQEHGIISAPVDWIGQQRIGDLVYVLPVHSCMTMDVLSEFMVV